MSKLSFEEGLRRLHDLLAAQSQDTSQSSGEEEAQDSPNGLSIEPKLEGKDNSVFSMLSASDGKKDESIISSQLVTVRLDEEEYDDYVKFFYPKSPSSFLPIIEELSQLASRTSGFFSLLRYCLANARRLSIMDLERQASNVNSAAGRIFDQVTKSDNADRVGKYLTTMNGGNSHTIEKSTRYANGYDIKFIGSPIPPDGSEDNISSISYPHGDNAVQELIPGGKDSNSVYEAEYLEAYATELSLGCIKAGEEVISLLFGEEATSFDSAAKRAVKTLPLDFDYNQINNIFFRNTGIALSVDFMENISNGVAKSFGKYVNVEALRTPKAGLINQVSLEMSKNQRNTPEGETPPRVPASFIENILTKEGFILSQIISFSFSLSIPETIARYISQSEEQEELSFLSMHNWISIWTKRYIRKPNSKTSGGRVRLSAMPKFVLPLSKAQAATKLRADNGFHMEKGKGDEFNVVISPTGSLQVVLPADAKDQIQDNLIGYERDMEAYLRFCYENGIPAQTLRTFPRSVEIALNDPTLNKQFIALLDKVEVYGGKILSYNWDYNNVITANVLTPTSIVAQDIVGTAVLDTLTKADYLGYNFAEEGAVPIRKSFADSLVLMTNTTLDDNVKAGDVAGNRGLPTQFMAAGGVSPDLLTFYRYCQAQGRVPGIDELIKLASQELGISNLESVDETMHNGVIGVNLAPDSRFRAGEKGENITSFLDQALTSVMRYANGNYLLSQKVAIENEGVDRKDLESLVFNDPDYFNPTSSPAADFGRLYNHLGGMIFKIAMERLTEVSPKDLFSIEAPVMINGTALSKASYGNITSKILPLAVMFSKYIPNAEETLREAEEAADANKPDDSIDVDDIKISGAVDTAQMFPHQVKAHQSLRKRPKFSIMDIAPGGGKTSLGMTDIGAMVKELNEIGAERIRPLILCPDGLIKNWVDDMKIFTGTKWNLIPLNRDIVSRWGYERLEEMIRDAPVNTVVVAGFNFVKGRAETVVFGTHSAKVSNNLEFMKRFGFDYICIDESHKLKNKKSLIHKTIKQLTTSSSVRFVRLATGTLISNKVDDVIGQASLFNGHIFRDGEISSNATVEAQMEKRDLSRQDAIDRGIDPDSEEYKQQDGIVINGEKIPVWEVDSPQRARRKLSRYSSVITMKKKEWAFMLPSPIETFFAVPMIPKMEDGASEQEIQLGEMHQQLYDAVIQKETEDIEELLAKVKKRKKASDDEDGGDDDDDDESEGTDFEMDENDELSGLSETQLTTRLERMERLVTNPMADPLAPMFFGAAGVDNYHSTKARFVAKRIDAHFNPEVWSKDKVYSEYTLVSHDSRLFLSRKLNVDSSTPTLLPESTRGRPPTDDVETWKEEPEGKILVFCRFTNSVNGIFNALPEHYQRIARKFTGEEDDKWGNLNSFVSDSKVKILVANEMGIAEGHNLQMASRIIRVESPWAPGDLDQSASRIFRPDPAAAKAMIDNGKPGELLREAVFLDWVLCNNSMEVPKQARLIAKVFNKARFDEAENPLYDDVLASYELDEIRMARETLASKASLTDYMEYVQAYTALNSIRREEFHQMRVTMDHSMRPLEAQDEVPGSRKIKTPYVANQKAEDPDGLKLVSLKNFLNNEDHADLLSDPNKLVGSPVATDQGYGRIVDVSIRYQTEAATDENGDEIRTSKNFVRRAIKKNPDGTKMADATRPITSFKVKLAGSNEVITLGNTGVAFIPTKLDAATAKRLFKVNNLLYTKTSIKRAEREAQKEDQEGEEQRKLEQKQKDKEEARELSKEARRRKAMKKEAEERKAAGEDGKKRGQNIRDGKPINQGINRVKDVPPIQRGRMEEDMTITLHPAYFHGFLTLELKATDPDAKKLKKFGFKDSGPYAYVEVDRYNRFDKLLDYIEDNFELSDQSIKRLDEVQESFDEGVKGPYRMDLAPRATLPFFFATRKRKVTNRKEIRPYPIILPDRLQIAVDITTSPIIKTHIGKTVPGAVAKWQSSNGHLLYFASSKGDLRSKVSELKKSGFTVENEPELKAEITNIKFRSAKNKK